MTGAPRTPRRAARRGPALVAALVLGLGAVVSALVGAGALLVHPCLPGDGVVGSLGVRLALLGPDAECPVGTLALDAGAPGAARLVVLVALPVLLAHLAATLAGVSLLVVVRSVWRAVGGAVASLTRLLPALTPVVRRAVRSVPAVPADRPWPARTVGAVRRRGPPVLLPV